MVAIATVEELQTNPSVNRAGYLVLHLDLNYILSFNFTKHEQKVQPGNKTKGCPTAEPENYSMNRRVCSKFKKYFHLAGENCRVYCPLK